MIELSDLEIGIAKIMATYRTLDNRASGVVDQKKSSRCGADIDYQGSCGELVVAKFLNVFPDFSIGPRKGGCDLIYKGFKIDAKYSYPHRNMLISVKKKLGDSDIYVQVWGTNPYEIVGWCWEREIIKPENIINLGYGNSYFMKQYGLHTAETLLHIGDQNGKPVFTTFDPRTRSFK